MENQFDKISDLAMGIGISKGRFDMLKELEPYIPEGVFMLKLKDECPVSLKDTVRKITEETYPEVKE